MRDIIFKAKRKDNGEWVQGYYFCGLKSMAGNKAEPFHGIYETYSFDGKQCSLMILHEVDPDTVCEYTGFTDKNGAKIFEGDILENDGVGATMDVFYGEIIGYGNGFQWRPIIGRIFESMTGFCDEYTIIGNRFDNPELLNP